MYIPIGADYVVFTFLDDGMVLGGISMLTFLTSDWHWTGFRNDISNIIDNNTIIQDISDL